uniref:Uncharacterized protein n=1 Tax=Panagrolaimus sp. JU765 TaxID=591449 RepID=A0AC34RKW2_9BILA
MRSKSLGTLLFSILIFVVVARNVRHVKNDWRNVPEYPGENSTQIQKVFLTQLENPNGKNVKIENNVLEFLRDAMVNISVKNNQLTLSVKEDNIVLGEKILYFCFKSTTQNYISTECPHGFCEIRMEFSTTSQSEAVHISFDNQTQVLLGKLVTAVISRNSMKVTNIPNDLQPITTCNPDYSQEYLTVKVINKGDKIVKLSDVNLHNETSENAALGTGSIIGIVAGCAVFVGLS